ncbi:hypothetical protein EW026_g7523 [Hermanssonia centrifuga]|uniref:Uncharacterized protein n=1 Tax=Hermanssonia centrifuga TaxID=98765 RepID=A0A4S4KC06_9APHY|nr:hypothetical protein EW026_g7523 [Hermanssonia centrifuga]
MRSSNLSSILPVPQACRFILAPNGGGLMQEGDDLPILPNSIRVDESKPQIFPILVQYHDDSITRRLQKLLPVIGVVAGHDLHTVIAYLTTTAVKLFDKSELKRPWYAAVYAKGRAPGLYELHSKEMSTQIDGLPQCDRKFTRAESFLSALIYMITKAEICYDGTMDSLHRFKPKTAPLPAPSPQPSPSPPSPPPQVRVSRSPTKEKAKAPDAKYIPPTRPLSFSISMTEACHPMIYSPQPVKASKSLTAGKAKAKPRKRAVSEDEREAGPPPTYNQAIVDDLTHGIGTVYRGEDIVDTGTKLPSMGKVIDDYLVSHGYQNDVIVGVYNAITLNPDWQEFRDVMLTYGMAEDIAWFIHKWVDMKMFGWAYHRDGYTDGYDG